VFLALAVGVVLGSVLLSDTVLSGLRDQNRDLHSQIDGLQGQQNLLGEKLSTANDFDTRIAGRLVRGGLADKSVVIFRTPDAHNDDVAAVSQLVEQAGGAISGTVSLTQQFVDDNSAEKLRSVVDSSIVPAGAQLNAKLVDQGSQAGDLLGIALLIRSGDPAPAVPAVDDGQRDTVLAAMRETGFLTYGDQHIGAANAAVVITGGALGDDAGNRGASVARFAATLAPHGSGAVLAGRDGCAIGTAAVAVARADAGIAGVISTVDDVDAESGRITAVMAASDLIHGGHPGQYGTGQGAGSVTVAQ
jgi:hypothetical protein